MMKTFLDKDFLLSTDTSKRLYEKYADMRVIPVIDYHCHINPQEIYEDRQFENITQVWLGGDHYKWRQMRTNGVTEEYITGNASDFDKFKEWAKTMPMLIGNPLYHWSHLELKYYFGYDGYLTEDNAEEVWNFVNEKLATKEYSVRNLIRKSNVKLICTTDDPIDSLEWHIKLKNDKSFDVKVLPAWRPDKAMLICSETFNDYLAKLSEVSSVKIESFSDLKQALVNRMDYFAEVGCTVSDHGLDYVPYESATDEEVNIIFEKAINKQCISSIEEAKFKTAFMLFLGREYAKRNWVMQLHYGCKRNNNTDMFEKTGPDTGFDCINDYTPSSQLSDFLNALACTGEIPKTIVYSLNPQDNAAIGTVIGCFQGGGIKNRIQQGSAWWFNDHINGMSEQMRSFAALSCLGNFVGMLTDSRSFLSYTRHDYFRRIMCDIIGNYVENGEYPNDEKHLSQIVKGISYNNAIDYFGFDLDKI